MRHGKTIKIGNWTEDNILQCLTQRGLILILLQRSWRNAFSRPLDKTREAEDLIMYPLRKSEN